MKPHDRTLSHGHVRVVDVGAGPTIVLVHGLGGSWQNWAANVCGLAQRHRVIALDLPGFGASEPYAGTVSMGQYVATLVELLDDLGVEQATFVGNSMGGLLTIETAVRHPDRVEAAVLVCSGGMPLTSVRHRLITIPQVRLINRLLRLNLSRWAVRRSRRVRLLLGGRVFHDSSSIQPELLNAALAGLSAPGFVAAAVAGAEYDARISGPDVGCPTLVIWGADDPLLPVSMGRELHRLIVDSTFEVWEQTGHCPMLEHPRRFDDRVAAFVEQHQA